MCCLGGEGTSATGETIREGQCTQWLGPGCHGQGYFTLTVNGVLGYRFQLLIQRLLVIVQASIYFGSFLAILL